MENQSGSGSTSPFGNEKGATLAGPSTGGGRDFTKESMTPQKSGGATYNPQSVPAGGTLPFQSAPSAIPAGNVPFKLNGGAPVEETDESEY